MGTILDMLQEGSPRYQAEAASTSEFVIDFNRSTRGNVTFSTEIMHQDLGKHRRIRDSDASVVAMKAQTQLQQWDEQWNKLQARKQAATQKEAALEEAKRQTEDARKQIAALENTLSDGVERKARVNWNDRKDRSDFSEPKPVFNAPAAPAWQVQPERPRRSARKYDPKRTIGDFFSGRWKQREEEAEARFDEDLVRWEQECQHIKHANEQADKAHEQGVVRLRDLHNAEVKKWREARAVFLDKQAAQHDRIDELRKGWQTGSPESVETYASLVLADSKYAEFCPQEFNLEYNSDNAILIVEYALPAPDALPTLTEIKYVITRKEFTEKHLPATKQRALYDSLLYQIALRTIHELFRTDMEMWSKGGASTLQAVVFNGYVTSIDKRTGKEATACVLSVQADRGDFMNIDLKKVDPKACFRSLSGVGSAKLHSITPVAPLLTLTRDDSRFVEDRAVVEALDKGDNLAAMDWEEFEHLIREVFAKEFSSGGGEVKVTQASRDGGVDAIAFDPDPIRGGKIVIQAKRYTNTVGVSAVRDLYGTVVNEGAMKGILVTTSSYGPDAHKFAADKPITLLDGGHLLHVLSQHGHKARIDLAEAKKIHENG